MNKLEQLQQIIDTALQGPGRSKLTNEVVDSIGGFTSPNIRHILNNLGAISTNYYEIGALVGASLVSTLYGNDHLQATSCDNFSLFSTEQQDSRTQFFENCNKFVPNRFKLLEKDFQTVVKEDLPAGIDLFFSDGPHSYEEQRQAITYTVPFLADEAIIVIDDFQWQNPCAGTMKGLKESDIDILWCCTLDSGVRSGCGDRDWWNGLGIFLIKKI